MSSSPTVAQPQLQPVTASTTTTTAIRYSKQTLLWTGALLSICVVVALAVGLSVGRKDDHNVESLARNNGTQQPVPSVSPSELIPSAQPVATTNAPTTAEPTRAPSGTPTLSPSSWPSAPSSSMPTRRPTVPPTVAPTVAPPSPVGLGLCCGCSTHNLWPPCVCVCVCVDKSYQIPNPPGFLCRH